MEWGQGYGLNGREYEMNGAYCGVGGILMVVFECGYVFGNYLLEILYFIFEVMESEGGEIICLGFQREWVVIGLFSVCFLLYFCFCDRYGM